MNRQKWKKLGVLFPCTDEDRWDQDPSAPFVMQVGDRLRMYYHGRQHGHLQIGMMEADPSDLLSWTKTSDEPRIPLGPEGGIDSHWVGYPWVVPITDEHWHLYYAAWGGTTICQVERSGVLPWRRAMTGA